MSLSRRQLLQGVAAGALSAALPGAADALVRRRRKPNILLILTDDLGYGELGCYGQTKIKTPNLDRLAAQGMRFTQAYAGSPVCAPSRCCLLTGLHTGHSAIRDNFEVGEWSSYEGQMPLPEGTTTIASVLKRAGYATACVGKWGLGRAKSSGDPNKQGFDFFYGFNCQRHAHNYYPAYLERNGTKEPLEGNDGKSATGRQYAPDLFLKEALGFVESHRQEPFFLYFATTIPHLALQCPADSVAEYLGKFEEKPYDGKNGYQPCKHPRSTYAAMITRMDRDVGVLLAKLEALGLAEDTVVIFTSDNGGTMATGGASPKFFASNGDLRGGKTEVYEGGIRVALIVRWPGRVQPATVSAMPCASWDFLPTLCDAAGTPSPHGIDGISLVPTLTGSRRATPKRKLYWEYAAGGGAQAVRMGEWKGVRPRAKKSPAGLIELYDLKADPAEKNDVASRHPDVVAEIERVMRSRRPSPIAEWNFGK